MTQSDLPSDLPVVSPLQDHPELSPRQLWLVAALILGFVFFPTFIACSLALMR